MCDGLIVAVQRNLSSEGKDNELQRVPGDLCAEVKLEVSKQQIFIIHFSVLELFINFVPLLIIFSSLDGVETVSLISGCILLNRRIFQSCIEVKLIVDKFEQHDIEIQEGRHDSVIDIDWQICGVFEWHDICDILSHDLRLIVHSFDANEDLLQGVRADHIELKVSEQLAAEIDLLSTEVELLVGWENGEEGHEGKWIVKVAQCVNKLRVTFSDEMVEADFGFMLGEVLDLADVALGLGFLELLEVDFLGADAIDDGVECKEVDILEMVVGSAGLLEFFWRLTRIDSLEDAEPAEILEGELQLLDGLSPAHVFDHLSSLTCFYLPHRWLLIINYNQIGLVPDVQFCLITHHTMDRQTIKEHLDGPFLGSFEHVEDSPNFLEHLCSSHNPMRDSNGEPEADEALSNFERESRRSAGKDKKKVFYRDKMAELLKPGEYIKQEYNYVTYPHFQHDKPPISKDEQLKRNRQSAKISRQRKKEYVAILEQKNQENMKEIEELKAKLQQVTLERDRLKEDNHQQIKNFLKSKAEAYENLQAIIKNPSSPYELIKYQIEFMLERFSASGSERVAVMNYYMNEIIEELISDIHKYFLTSATFNQGYTPYNPPKQIDLQVMQILDLDLARMSHLVCKFRERFNKEASVFKTLTQEFYRVFKCIENQSKIIELVFLDMIKEIDNRKIGDLIIWFEENQFCRQVKRVRKEWIDQLKTGEENIEQIRKQTKQ